MTLEKEFEQAMVESVKESRKHGYYPTIILSSQWYSSAQSTHC